MPDSFGTLLTCIALVVVPFGVGASLVDFNSDGQQGFGLRQNAAVTNQFKLRWRNQPQTAWEGETAPLATAGSGQPQVMTWVKSGTSQIAYVNGTQQSSATVALSMFTPTNALAVGGSVTAAGDYFTGQVAEVFGNKFIIQDDSGRTLVDTGPRGEGGFYAAYFRDPEGNKLNAFVMG